MNEKRIRLTWPLSDNTYINSVENIARIARRSRLEVVVQVDNRTPDIP